MATTGWLMRCPPIDPKNCAAPKAKMPPSDATSQYPPPWGMAAIPTIGAARAVAPMDPKNCASPKAKMPAVRRHEPVAAAVGRRCHADDGRGEVSRPPMDP